MSVWWGTAPLVVGHRGGRGDGWPPENTLASFEQARAQGATAIELDVRTCAGGNVVVFHDDTLARMTRERDPRRIADVTEAELFAIDLGAYRQASHPEPATVPALSEVLAWARAHGIGVNVELKHEVPSRAVLARATAEIVRDSGADVLLSSFDPLLLALAGARAPEVPRALLTHRDQKAWAGVLQEAARRPLIAALHIERTQATPDALARYRRRGLRVGVWTVNDVAEARELVRLGAASIITDHPGEMLAALSR
jgi:glycerophosphoryl diester phosphodiesterase